MFFFLSCYFHHLDLHSFPTRRSSDLYFRRLETGLAQGWFPEEIPDEEKVRELGDGRVVQRIDRRTANEILTAARNDRGAALMLLRDRTRFEEPHRYLGEDSGDEIGRAHV